MRTVALKKSRIGFLNTFVSLIEKDCTASNVFLGYPISHV